MSEICFCSIYWERIDKIWPNFAYALILTKSRLGLLRVNFHQIVTELWPLMIHDFCRNFVSPQYLKNEWMEFDQNLVMHWYWQNLGLDCYATIVSQIYNRVMALNWCLKFVSAQYLENESMELDQVLYMHWNWQDLGWNCYSSILTNLLQSYDPWLMSEICFRSVSWEWIDGIWPSFAYALKLTRSRLGLFFINFHKFVTELWPLIDVRNLFPLNILRMNW